MDPYEAEIQRLLQLYDEVPSDVPSEEESDDLSDDASELSLHESDTEQEDAEDIEENQECSSAQSEIDRRLYYFGKEGTKWRKHVPPRNVRTRQENIVTHLPGVIGAARNAIDPYQCWMHMFENIIEIVVENTNLYIDKIKSRYAHQEDAKPTNTSEIKAFIGLLYLAGVQHGGRRNLREFWQNDGMGSEIFVAAMAQRRFEFLVKCLRFDDTNTREIRKQQDKLSPVRNMIETFVDNCKSNYSVGELVTLDEMLLGFRGRCSFKIYIPNKPNKYGIKVFSVVDARTFYTHNLEIYVGVQPDGPFKLSNSTFDVTERMVRHLSGSGRNVTMDRWFTSVQIVNHLLENHRLTVVGTIRANRRELPPQVTNVKQRPVNSSLFAFGEKITAVSYVPKRSKNVLMLSSMHKDDAIDESTGASNKPEIVTFYNSTKSGVDVVDRMITSYNVARGTRRWPMVIFYGLLNIASINAFVIYRSNNPEGEFFKKRRLFQKALGLELVQDNVKTRATNLHLPRQVRTLAGRLSGMQETVENPPPGKRGYCKYCKRRKTKHFCKFCKAWLCMEHIQACCVECTEKFNM